MARQVFVVKWKSSTSGKMLEQHFTNLKDAELFQGLGYNSGEKKLFVRNLR